MGKLEIYQKYRHSSKKSDKTLRELKLRKIVIFLMSEFLTNFPKFNSVYYQILTAATTKKIAVSVIRVGNKHEEWAG